MVTFSAAASFLASSFERATRDDGGVFYKVSSSAPDWITDAVRESHDGEFPNDTRYELIRDAAIAIAYQLFDDAEDARDAILEHGGDLIPSDTFSLLQWFSAYLSRLDDCDAGKEEWGATDPSIFDHLCLGYRKAAETVLSVLIDAIEDNRAAIFNPDTDCRLLIRDANGIYIPQLYCQQLTEDDAADCSIEWADVVCCQSGPEQEWYWESWQAILDSAEITEPATLKEDESVWRLHQNGDLWMVRADVELPEDF